jgi:hypothetical protein
VTPELEAAMWELYQAARYVTDAVDRVEKTLKKERPDG